jgi:senataxin
MPAFLSDLVNRQPVPWPTDLTALEAEDGVAQAQLPDDRPLNTTQLSVVTRLASTSAGGLFNLIGPPGTGKTHTIVHLLAERVRNFPAEKILLTAPSNKAVHVVLSQLLRKIEHPPLVAFTGVLRHVPRHLEEVVASEYGFFLNQLIVDAITSNETLGKKVVDLNGAFQEIDARLTRLTRSRGCEHVLRRKEQSVMRLHRYVKKARVTLGESNFTDEAELVQHVEEITLTIDRAKQDLEDFLLSKCQVLFSTLTASGRKGLSKVLGRFDTVFVDEASQAIIPETFIPFKFHPKLYVLIGDPQQLPGTVAHSLANRGFADSMMSVMTHKQQRPHLEMLTTQYRMHPSINKWISDSFYDGELTPDVSLLSRASALDALPPSMLLSGVPSAFVDVEGTEEREPLGSICNKREVEVVVATVRFLLKNGVRPEQIGIITFYAAQARVLQQQLYELETVLRKEAVAERSRRKRLALDRVRRGEIAVAEGSDWDIVAGIPKVTTEGMVVSTVDSFQGDERDFTLISCVRTSPSVGFLNDHRRVNVAMSRAKHARWVFGSSEVLRKSNSMFRDFFQWESREAKNCVQPVTRVVRCEDLLQSIGTASAAEHSIAVTLEQPQEASEVTTAKPSRSATKGLPALKSMTQRSARKSPATPQTPKPFTYDVPEAAMYKFPDDWW